MSGLDFVGKCLIVAYQVLDLADRMQHGGVVAAAEPPPDLRQRAKRHGFGEVHGDLPWADYVGGPPGRQQVAAADVIVTATMRWMSSILTRL